MDTTIILFDHSPSEKSRSCRVKSVTVGNRVWLPRRNLHVRFCGGLVGQSAVSAWTPGAAIAFGFSDETIAGGLSNSRRRGQCNSVSDRDRNLQVRQKGCPLAFESEEIVLGCVRQSEDRIECRGILRVRESEENPVSLELDFVPPHPFLVNMPTRLSISAGSVTEAYSKLVRVFEQHGVDLDTRVGSRRQVAIR